MTYSERVRAAHNPPEALLAIAEGIDEILSREPATTDDWWSATASFDPPGMPGAVVTSVTPARDEEAIAAVQRKISETTDGQELEALQARLRVLNDPGTVIEDSLAEGRRSTVTDTGDTLTVELPPPSPERVQGRREFAETNRLWEFLTMPGLTEEQFVDAWGKGGPLWLYLGDREAIMTMPVDWRRAFVNDIQVDSPAQAHEVARDILKDLTTQDAGTVLPMGG